MTDGVFQSLSIIIVIAAAVAFFMRAIKQPPILGYILSGIIVGPAALNLIKTPDSFDTFANLGITLLLFIIGLGLNIAVVKRLGRAVFSVTAVELVLVGGVGWLVASALGFSAMTALIIALCLFFSSTIIIVKTLADKNEQSRLHGQIAIGINLLQDVIAMVVLLFVAANSSHGLGLAEAGRLILKGVLLIGFLVLAAKYLLPRLTKFAARSQELLFLFAIAWGVGVASLFEVAGFSIEVGALFAGVSLASLAYTAEIEARLKPLRDFFVVLFFIVLGERLGLHSLASAIGPALILSAIVIVLKPTTITATLGLMGYTRRVSFLTGINVSQISEFSVVLIALAATTGIVGGHLVSIITLVTIITIAISAYMSHYDRELLKWFNRLPINLFASERADGKKSVTSYPLVLFGYHKGGHEFLKTFREMHRRYVVVDYDPGVIEILKHERVPCLYGDATDTELLEEIGIAKTKLVVSTIGDFEVNSQLVRHINLVNPEASIICNASSYEEALQLYELGSTYVMVPHYMSSERLSGFIRDSNMSRQKFLDFREEHLEHLRNSHALSLAEEAL